MTTAKVFCSYCISGVRYTAVTVLNQISDVLPASITHGNKQLRTPLVQAAADRFSHYLNESRVCQNANKNTKDKEDLLKYFLKTGV